MPCCCRRYVFRSALSTDVSAPGIAAGLAIHVVFRIAYFFLRRFEENSLLATVWIPPLIR